MCLKTKLYLQTTMRVMACIMIIHAIPENAILQLSMIPQIKLKLYSQVLRPLKIIKENGGYLLKIDDKYLSFLGSLILDLEKHYWKVRQNRLGYNLVYDELCLTYSDDTLNLEECAQDTKFEAVYQSFGFKPLELTDDEIYHSDYYFDTWFSQKADEQNPFVKLERLTKDDVFINCF